MLDLYEEELQLIFNIYAAMDQTGVDEFAGLAAKLETMNIEEFHQLLQDASVCDDSFTFDVVKYIFAQIQHVTEDDDDEIDEPEEGVGLQAAKIEVRTEELLSAYLHRHDHLPIIGR